MNKNGHHNSSCRHTPNSKMVETTHLQSMPVSCCGCSTLLGTDKMLSRIWYFLPTSVTHSLEKKNIKKLVYISQDENKKKNIRS